MSFLLQLFGSSREEVWRRLAEETGSSFVDGGFWHGSKVVIRVKEWTLTLDTFTVSTGKHSTTYTRLRAPYVNKDGFRFRIYRKSVFSGLGKLFGMQDIEIGEPEFDESFIIQSNNPGKVRQLLSHEPLRAMITEQPNFHVQVKDDEGWFGAEFPKGVDELYFAIPGVIKDLDRLKSLFKIFALILHLLCHLDSAYENDPNIRLA
jgi:hypothetical protein